MIFLVINPLNCSEFNVFGTVEEAVSFLESNGYKLAAHRDIKVSPRVRLVYTKGNDQTRNVYCRNMGVDGAQA